MPAHRVSLGNNGTNLFTCDFLSTALPSLNSDVAHGAEQASTIDVSKRLGALVEQHAHHGHHLITNIGSACGPLSVPAPQSILVNVCDVIVSVFAGKPFEKIFVAFTGLEALGLQSRLECRDQLVDGDTNRRRLFDFAISDIRTALGRH